MRRFREVIAGSCAVTGAIALVISGAAASTAATGAQPGARVLLASTDPAAGAVTTALPASSQVRVSVFAGRDQAGLTAQARAVSDPRSSSYAHFLSPAQVQAQFGATAAQQQTVARWLTASGLTVTARDAFVITATGTAAQAGSALQSPLAFSGPFGRSEQVISTRAMSVPAAIAASVTTIRVAPAIAPKPQQQQQSQQDLAAATRGTASAGTLKEVCPAYYGQRLATQVPRAVGGRIPTWAPCGYLPQQVRGAYGATRSGLTGRGVTVAILSGDDDKTALADANRWARARHFPPFAPGQFKAVIAPDAYPGTGDIESALDVEAMHAMAPAATIDYVTGSGSGTGDALLDGMETIVDRRLARVVSCSWYEGYMAKFEGRAAVTQSEIDSWESVLERAAVEGIAVNFATGDEGSFTPLQYPGSSPWATLVGGTSLAIGAGDRFLWENAWQTDETGLSSSGISWDPPAPGNPAENGTGGISTKFPEPFYQRGVVSGNKIDGKSMRAVPDVAALGDWNLGFQVGLTAQISSTKFQYVNAIYGGTSLAVQLFGGLEADLIQGRHGIPLGFFNPALYDMAGTPALRDITAAPRDQSVVIGPLFQNEPQLPTLSTMGECGGRPALPCGPGYDTATGLGSPGPEFFNSFGSHSY
jgi:subtilase family serine protease